MSVNSNLSSPSITPYMLIPLFPSIPPSLHPDIYSSAGSYTAEELSARRSNKLSVVQLVGKRCMLRWRAITIQILHAHTSVIRHIIPDIPAPLQTRHIYLFYIYLYISSHLKSNSSYFRATFSHHSRDPDSNLLRQVFFAVVYCAYKVWCSHVTDSSSSHDVSKAH